MKKDGWLVHSMECSLRYGEPPRVELSLFATSIEIFNRFQQDLAKDGFTLDIKVISNTEATLAYKTRQEAVDNFIKSRYSSIESARDKGNFWTAAYLPDCSDQSKQAILNEFIKNGFKVSFDTETSILTISWM